MQFRQNTAVRPLDRYDKRDPVQVLGHIRRSLPGISRTLLGASRDLEPRFLRIGENLQRMQTEADELAEQAQEGADCIRRGINGDLLRDIAASAHRSLGVIRSEHDRIACSLDEMSRIATELGLLRPKITALGRVAHRLRTVNLHFSIESARSDSAAAVFASFIARMGGLIDHIGEVTDRLRDDALAAETQQGDAYTSARAGLAELMELAGAAERAMVEATHDIEMVTNASTDFLSRVGEHSSTIARQVSDIVVALQFHDIVRQRMEHIIDAISDLQSACASPDALGAGGSSVLNQAYSLITVQTAQLESVIGDLTGACDRIGSALCEIDSEAAELSTCTADVDHDASSSRKTSTLQSLVEQIRRLDDLTDGAGSLSAQARDAVARASEIHLRLNEHVEQVRSITLDINLQALNAVINSVTLGDRGKTLTVLAKETTSVSRHCETLVHDIISTLHAIASMAQRADLGSDAPAQSVSADSSPNSLSDSMDQVSDTYRRLTDSSAAACHKALNLAERIGSAQRDAASLPSLRARLDDCLTEMLDLAAELRPWDDGAVEPDQRAGDLVRRYTMESERTIHFRVLGSDAEDDEPGGRFGSAPSGLGDNVELF